MAKTTATISITSEDLMPGMPLAINASSELMQTGNTTGLELVDLGAGKLTEASAADALHEALGTIPYEYAIFKSTYTLPAKT